MEQYHEALCKEIKSVASCYTHMHPLETLYIGGGTPSTYPNALLLDMFGTLKDVFKFNEKIEITLEVNPGTVDLEQLPVWQQAGINRLSIGVQSLKDNVLQKLNRHQSAADVHWLLKHAAPVIENLSVDFILGLPEVSDDEWRDLLMQAVTWPIKHISMYFLMVHENTPLYFKVKRNQITLPPDDPLIDLYHWSVDYLAQHGFEQYEVSNFAKPGYASVHNQVYWEHKPYAAFGLGACSFDGKRRFRNEKNLLKYMQLCQEGKRPVGYAEELTHEQLRLEKIMLGLRSKRGVSRSEIMDGCSTTVQDALSDTISWLIVHGFANEVDGNLLLSPAGLAVENDIVMKLSQV